MTTKKCRYFEILFSYPEQKIASVTNFNHRRKPNIEWSCWHIKWTVNNLWFVSNILYYTKLFKWYKFRKIYSSIFAIYSTNKFTFKSYIEYPVFKYHGWFKLCIWGLLLIFLSFSFFRIIIWFQHNLARSRRVRHVQQQSVGSTEVPENGDL